MDLIKTQTDFMFLISGKRLKKSNQDTCLCQGLGNVPLNVSLSCEQSFQGSTNSFYFYADKLEDPVSSLGYGSYLKQWQQKQQLGSLRGKQKPHLQVTCAMAFHNCSLIVLLINS